MRNLSKSIFTTAAAALVAGGILLAQGPHAGGPGGHQNFLATYLNLTDAQKAQLKTISDNAKQTSEPLRQTLKQQEQAVEDAIKAGKSPTEIEQLANAEGPTLGQLAAVKASMNAQLFAILTPDQQQKMSTMQEHMGPRGEGHAPPTQ